MAYSGLEKSVKWPSDSPPFFPPLPADEFLALPKEVWTDTCLAGVKNWGEATSVSLSFFFFSFTKMWPMLHRKGHKRQRSSWGKVKSESEVAQSCLTLCDPMYHSLPGFSIHGIFPGNSTRVGCHFLLQGIFRTQGSNPGLPHRRQKLYPLSLQGRGGLIPVDKGTLCSLWSIY